MRAFEKGDRDVREKRNTEEIVGERKERKSRTFEKGERECCVRKEKHKEVVGERGERRLEHLRKGEGGG
jgi:hypothetical protein